MAVIDTRTPEQRAQDEIPVSGVVTTTTTAAVTTATAANDRR